MRLLDDGSDSEACSTLAIYADLRCCAPDDVLGQKATWLSRSQVSI